MITPKVRANAHKITYLVQQYPEHTITQIIELLGGMPPIDINAAMWAAQEAGYIAEPDEDTQMTALLTAPKKWSFGDEVEQLKDTLLYCLEKVAQREIDMEENYLANWTVGYLAVDVLIATKRLEETGQIVQYTIDDHTQDDEVNTYTFFTLAENEGKLWGRKQFKRDPLADPEPQGSPRALQEQSDDQAEMQSDLLREDEGDDEEA